jgi:hypothetical protein
VPFTKISIKPGLFRDVTATAAEGQWFACDKIRFRSGSPEKLGGWVLDTGGAAAVLQPPAGAYWGIARAMFTWQTGRGERLLALGTDLKYYVQNGGNSQLHDITPLRDTDTVASNAFTTVAGSTTVLVNASGHGAGDGDFVTISGVSGPVNGVPAASLNREFRLTYVGPNAYTITADAPATSSGTAGAATFAYQVNTGLKAFVYAFGWGSGGWGAAGWGEASTTGGAVLDLRLWSQSNYGDYLLLNPRGGPLYLWVPNANPSVFDRAGLLSSTSSGAFLTDADCPSVCNQVLVSDASRFVIGFGVNDYGSATQDPLLVRWSDQEDYALWTPAITNQAGSYRLSQGSQIVGAHQTRQEILVFTDIAVYSMQYLGPPYVWGFQMLGSNISVASQNAVITANNTVFWMGYDKFYLYNGRVDTLECTIWREVFGNINLDQQSQFFAGLNEGFSEVWWFYCSAGSQTIDRYVVFDYAEGLWHYGTMARTAWLDTPLRQTPVAAGYNGQLIYHEVGVDDGTTNPPTPIQAFIQSADFDIGDGDRYAFVDKVVPDVNFDGSTVNNPRVNFSVRPRQNPGAAYGPAASPTVASLQNYVAERSYEVQEFTQLVYVRVRGRQMALRVSSDTLGVMWQLGVPRVSTRPDGRR